jgi:hypothetical protein
MPDFYRLSQSLRILGAYLDKREMQFRSLRREGGNFFLEFQDRDGKQRIEEHGIGTFEPYFTRVYLRRKNKAS